MRYHQLDKRFDTGEDRTGSYYRRFGSPLDETCRIELRKMDVTKP